MANHLSNYKEREKKIRKIYNKQAESIFRKIDKILKPLINKELITVYKSTPIPEEYLGTGYSYQINEIKGKKSVEILLEDTGVAKIDYEFKGGKENVNSPLKLIDKKYLNSKFKFTCKDNLEIYQLWEELNEIQRYFISKSLPVKRAIQSSFLTFISDFKLSKDLEKRLNETLHSKKI